VRRRCHAARAGPLRRALRVVVLEVAEHHLVPALVAPVDDRPGVEVQHGSPTGRALVEVRLEVQPQPGPENDRKPGRRRRVMRAGQKLGVDLGVPRKKIEKFLLGQTGDLDENNSVDAKGYAAKIAANTAVGTGTLRLDAHSLYGGHHIAVTLSIAVRRAHRNDG